MSLSPACDLDQLFRFFRGRETRMSSNMKRRTTNTTTNPSKSCPFPSVHTKKCDVVTETTPLPTLSPPTCYEDDDDDVKVEIVVEHLYFPIEQLSGISEEMGEWFEMGEQHLIFRPPTKCDRIVSILTQTVIGDVESALATTPSVMLVPVKGETQKDNYSVIFDASVVKGIFFQITYKTVEFLETKAPLASAAAPASAPASATATATLPGLCPAHNIDLITDTFVKFMVGVLNVC